MWGEEITFMDVLGSCSNLTMLIFGVEAAGCPLESEQEDIEKKSKGQYQTSDSSSIISSVVSVILNTLV